MRKILIILLTLQNLFFISEVFCQILTNEKEYNNWTISKNRRPAFKTYDINEFNSYIADDIIFNTPFTLKMTSSNPKSYGKLGFYIVNGFKKTSSKKSTRFKRSNGEIRISQNSREKNKVYLDVPSILPNKEYLFILPKSLPEKDQELLHQLNSKMASKSYCVLKKYSDSKPPILSRILEPKRKEVEKELLDSLERYETSYNEILKDKQQLLLDKVIKNNNQSELAAIKFLLKKNGFEILTFEDYLKKVFLNNLYISYEDVRKKYCKNYDNCKISREILDDINVEKIDSFIDLSKKLTPFVKKDEKMEILLSKFHQVKEKGKTKDLLIGKIGLEYIHIPNYVVEDVTQKKRKKNITETITSIKQISSFYKTKRNTFTIPFIPNFEYIIGELLREQLALKQTYKSISEAIKAKGNNIYQLEVFYGSTFPSSFSSSVKNYIKSDLGFQSFKSDALVTTDSLGGLDTLNRFANNTKPYFGILIHPFGINEDLPLGIQPFGNRFFVHMGISLGSLKIESTEEKNGIRTPTIIRDDFFGTNNIMLGGGFRLSRSFHISAGGIFMRNSKGKLKPQRYISIGVHPDIGTIVSTLTGFIFK